MVRRYCCKTVVDLQAVVRLVVVRLVECGSLVGRPSNLFLGIKRAVCRFSERLLHGSLEVIVSETKASVDKRLDLGKVNAECIDVQSIQKACEAFGKS